jgi:hypothetical protein
MRHEFGSASYIALVLPVANLSFDSHDDRLLHFVTGYQSDLFLSTMSWRCSSGGTLGLRGRVSQHFAGGLVAGMGAHVFGTVRALVLL